MRTSFTNEQLSRLEKEFARQQYMVGSERFVLASNLQLTEAQVNTPTCPNHKMHYSSIYLNYLNLNNQIKVKPS